MLENEQTLFSSSQPPPKRQKRPCFLGGSRGADQERGCLAPLRLADRETLSLGWRRSGDMGRSPCSRRRATLTPWLRLLWALRMLWVMSSACSAAVFIDSTMAWNWGPNSPSGLIGASSSTFLAASVTDACCSQRWRWICVTHVEILAWATATDAHRVSAVLAALLISSASSEAKVVWWTALPASPPSWRAARCYFPPPTPERHTGAPGRPSGRHTGLWGRPT